MNFINSNTIFIFTLLVAAFLFFKNRGPSSNEIKQLLQSDQILWVDVREKDEVAEGSVAQAYWVPLSTLQQKSPDLSQQLSGLDKNKKIAVFCRSGNRSGIATKIFQELGYTRAFNAGGFSHLKSNGVPSGIPQKESIAVFHQFRVQ